MRKQRRVGSRVFMTLVFLFLYAPILLMIIFSFNAGNSSVVWQGFSLHWYEELFRDRAIMQSFTTTLLVSLLATVLVVGSLLALVIGGCIEMGQATFNLHLMRGQRAVFPDLFSQFHRLGAGIAMVILRSVFVWLWSLLFVIPGIIATYRYAMMPFLMAEFPDLGALDAMRESKRLMQGNKWRLFCLELSFLGWAFLCMFTLGIGMLWLLPYMASARTAFYLEVTGRSHEQQQTYRSPEF